MRFRIAKKIHILNFFFFVRNGQMRAPTGVWVYILGHIFYNTWAMKLKPWQVGYNSGSIYQCIKLQFWVSWIVEVIAIWKAKMARNGHIWAARKFKCLYTALENFISCMVYNNLIPDICGEIRVFIAHIFEKICHFHFRASQNVWRTPNPSSYRCINIHFGTYLLQYLSYEAQTLTSGV